MSEITDTASAPILEINGARATIRLNRPKHLNRLQSEDLGDLVKLFDWIEADHLQTFQDPAGNAARFRGRGSADRPIRNRDTSRRGRAVPGIRQVLAKLRHGNPLMNSILKLQLDHIIRLRLDQHLRLHRATAGCPREGAAMFHRRVRDPFEKSQRPVVAVVHRDGTPRKE